MRDALSPMLSSETRFDPAEVEPRITERWLAQRSLPSRARGDAAAELLDRDPAAERHRLAAHGPRAQRLDAGRARPLPPHARPRAPSGSSAPTTPASPPRRRSRSSCAPRARTREELGREEFVERVWEWREHYGHTIVEQFKRLGASCDYDEERFTLDEDYARAVVEVFVALYEKGYIYRDRYIVNWDPGSRSAISDLEVEERSETDTLYSIVYDLEGGGDRHDRHRAPGDDARPTPPSRSTRPTSATRDLVGREAILPLVGRRLPIIADDYVKTDFGTGQLKVTPGARPQRLRDRPSPRPRPRSP